MRSRRQGPQPLGADPIRRGSATQRSLFHACAEERQCGEAVNAGKRGLTSNHPCWPLDLGLAASRTVKGYIFVV